MIKKTFGQSVSGAADTIYTVPAGKKAEWVLMWVTNPGSSGTIEIDYYNKASDSTLVVLDGYTVDQNEFLKVGGEPNAFFMMNTGDKIIAEAESGKTFSVFISVIEHEDLF